MNRFIVFCLLFFVLKGFSQDEPSQILDSLHSVYQKTTDDSIKLTALYSAANLYYRHNPDTAIIICEKAVEISKKIDDKNQLSQGYGWLAYLTGNKGDIEKSIEYNFKALKIAEEVGNKYLSARLLVNIASEQIGLEEFEDALKNLYKAIAIQKEIKDTIGMCGALNNIGLCYYKKGRLDSAEAYYKEAMSLYKKVNHEIGAAQSYQSLATLETKRGNHRKALEYYDKILPVYQKHNDLHDLTYLYQNISGAYLRLDDYEEAEKYGLLALKKAKEINNLTIVERSSEILSKIYEKKNDFKKALEYYRLEVQMRDSLEGERKQKVMIKNQMQHDFEKKEAVEKAKHESEMKIEHEKQKRRDLVILLTSIGLLLIIILSMIIYRRLKITRKQKVIIENQKQLIEDSINYAKNIQSAVLPETPLSTIFPESFLMYKPKDIVSGDFYWWEQTEDKILFAVADCTGHGVPGGFMSMLGSIFLNEIFNSKKIHTPSEVLNTLSFLMKISLRKEDGTYIKDGMDISFACLDKKTLKLEWAGAHNPIYIFRNGELIEIRADRQAIGYSETIKKFTNHEFQTQKNDCIYLFSDGYIDQFGKNNLKKFSSKRFKSTLNEIHSLKMSEQGIKFEKVFNEWKGSTEQLDDICILGVRI